MWWFDIRTAYLIMVIIMIIVVVGTLLTILWGSRKDIVTTITTQTKRYCMCGKEISAPRYQCWDCAVKHSILEAKCGMFLGGPKQYVVKSYSRITGVFSDVLVTE